MSLRPVAVSFLLLATFPGCAAAPATTPQRETPAASAAPKAAPPKAEQLAGDTPTSTPAGATFEAPKGWWLTKHPHLLVLEAPERDVSITLFEAKEKDIEKAIALAWTRASHGFARKPKQTTKPPRLDGWDEITQIVYETSAAESRLVLALGRRKGDVTYVTLLDGSMSGLDRRDAQIQTAIGSFRAKGVFEESFAGKTASTLDAARLDAYVKFLEEAQVSAKLPGISIAIIQDGKIVLEKGLGVRTLGKKEPVTPDTLFIIGSITKSLTSLMMAKLVDEGRFRWDTPLTEVAPGFSLGDPEATNKLTMRHTLCACTGLPRQDMTFFFGYSKATPESRVAEMKTMKPTTGFGEIFQYSNLMVSAGGYLAAHAAEPDKALGPSYDAVLRSRVLGPLGMTTSTLDFAAASRANHASPHSFVPPHSTTAMPIATEAWIPAIRPAGGLWSSAHEMARWVATELGRGKTLDGKVIVSEANLVERYKPMARVDDKTTYGLGIEVEKLAGVDVVSHTGGTLGFNAIATWLPEHRAGLVVLTNTNGAGAFLRAARRRFVELLFDGKEEAKENLAFSMKRRLEANEKDLAKVERAPEAAWIDALAGTYANPVLGRLTIRREKDRAIVDAGEWKSTLGRIKEDDGGERIVVLDPPFTFFEFLRQGNVLTLDAAQEKYAFTRAP